MLDEIAAYVRFADEAGFAGFGHPEHHLQGTPSAGWRRRTTRCGPPSTSPRSVTC
jgi:alkanesulfonate monooxygenase SsuD/methylene tetrahydromethanopterin reductase-like flavin-dependent oxidoreductase (luciferase family)